MRQTQNNICSSPMRLKVLCFFLLLGMSIQLDQCTDPKATFYDGYLDTFIYYAQFNRDQGSYLKFKNPFQGTANLQQGSVMLWAKLPKLSDDAVYQRGRLFECTDSIAARLDNSTLRVNFTSNVTLANGSLTSQLNKQTLDIALFVNNTDQLLQWNSFAFSFKDKKFHIHFNGVQVAELALNYTNMNTYSDSCIVGNSLDLRDPYNGYMRHLVFSKEGFSSNQDITTKIRSVVLPNDTNVLAYFKFQKEFNYQEAYFYNATRNFTQSNVTIQYSSEPEQVCYCTASYPAFLKVTKDYQLKPLDLTPLNANIDQNGITFQFWVYPIKFENGDNDTAIFSLSSYADIILANKGQNLRVDLYNSDGTVGKQVSLTKYRFRFQFWTLYTIQISSTQVLLYVDGTLADSATHTIALPTIASQIIIQQPTTLQFLLYNITLQNYKKTITYFNQTFTQDQLLPLFQTQYTKNGTLKFDSNNQLCLLNNTYKPTAFIDSAFTTCKDNRDFGYFNKDTSNTGIAMTGSLKSSMTTMTMEMWVKDMFQGSSTSAGQVLMENSVDSKNPLIRMTLVDTGSASNDAVKGIKVYTYLANSPNTNIMLTTGKTYNNWIHLSIISNSTTLKINLYNQTKKTTDSIQQASIVFFANNNELNTSLGSSINGTNKFTGFIKEFRLWNTAKQDTDIATYRFQTIKSPTNGLLYYFRLNNGGNQYYLYDSYSTTGKYMSEISTNITSVKYQTDKDLAICRLGSYYDGQCCQDVNLTGLDFKFGFSSSKNYIQLSIINTTTAQSATMMKSVYANFSVFSIGYEFNSTILKSVTTLFNFDNSQGLNVSSLLVHPLIYNLTIQAKIFSIYDKRVLKVTKTILLQCPGYYLQLNSDPVNDNNYYVTNSTDGYVKLTLKTIQNTSQCFNPAKRIVENITISQKIWSQSITTPTFSNLWNISTDNSTLLQKQGVANTNKWNKVALKVYYNITQITETFINLSYVPLSVINSNFPNSSFIRNFYSNQIIDIDLSASASSDSNFAGLTYGVICPSDLFNDINQYNNLCKITTGGKFQLKTTSDQSLKIIYNKKYYFTFLIGIVGTSVVRSLQGNITLYKDGSSLTECPTVIFSVKYDYDKVLNASLEIYPDPYLYCSGKFYDVQKIDWTVMNSDTNKQLIGIVNQTNSSILSTFLYQTNNNIQNVAGGSTLSLNGQFTSYAASLTGIILPVQSSTFNKTTTILFKKNPLIPKIVAHSFNKTVLNPLSLGFLEANVTLNGSSSFDPDNKTAVLNYTWTCPSIISDQDCKTLLTGTRNNSILITLIQKFQFNLQFNTNYTFTLAIFTKDNLLREQQNVSLNVSFAYPYFDEVGYDMRNTSCEYLDAYSNDIQQDSIFGKIIEYTKNDWNQKQFTLNMKIDNASTATKSPCGGNNVEQQYMFYFLFNGAVSNSQNLVPLLIQNIMPVQKSFTTDISLSQFTNLPNMVRDQLIITTVYLFTKRQGSNRLYLNTQTIFLIRRYSPLIAVLNQTEISLDRYNNLILDASKSYDSEDSNNKRLSYQWSCPNDLQACKNTNGPILNITMQTRIDNYVNDLGSQNEYSVVATSGSRISNSVTAAVTIVYRDDYSDCISVSLNNNQKSLSGDFDQENRTMFLEYNQTTNIIITMGVTWMCDNINVYMPQWSNPDPNGQQFWALDSSNNNRISISNKFISKMIAGQSNTITYQQQISMGNDKDKTFQYFTYLNIFLNKPDIQPIVNGQLVYVYGQDQLINLNANKSIDLLNMSYTCQWDCPSYFGGLNCGSQCNFKFYMQQIKNAIGSQSLFYYLDMSHQFTLTISSSDGDRVVTSNQYVYLSRGIQSPFTLQGIQNCSIQLYNKQQFQIYQTNVYYYACTNKDDLTSYIIDSNNFIDTWSIQGLVANTDYYNISGQLFIKPYAATKLTNHQLLISLNSTSKNGQSLRMLQDELQPSDDSSDSSSTSDNSSTNQDSNDDSTSENNIPTTSNSDTSNQSTNVPSPTTSNDDSTYANYTETNMTSARYKKDSNQYRQFVYVREVLQQGTVVLSYDNQTAYTSKFNFTFSDFASLSKATILVQLRGQQALYGKVNLLIVPLKPFVQDTINQYYTNAYIPLVTSLYLDFFDMNFNYIGSYDVYSNLLNNITMGLYQFQAFEKLLFVTSLKTEDDYPNNDAGKVAFEQDIKRLLEFTEMFSLNAIYGFNDIILSNYAQKIVSYLKINLETNLAYYDETASIQEARSKYVIQKRVLVMVYNLITKGTGIETKVLSLLDAISNCVQDYDQLINSGEDADFLRTVIMYLQGKMNIQLVNINLNNKGSYFDKLYNISNIVYTSDANSANSSQKITQYTTTTTSRTVFQITKGSTAPIYISNALNTKEKVSFSSEDILANLNVASLTVQYDSDTNTSSAVSTGITINAFDTSNNKVAISFMDSKSSYFSFTLQVKDTVIALYKSNSTKYQIKGVYYDTSSNKWLDSGVSVDSVDTSSNVINFKAYHLTQFSVQYIVTDSSSSSGGTNNNGTTNNGTNNNGTYNNGTQNNGTNNNGTQNNGSDNNKTNKPQNLLIDDTYYVHNNGAFAAAIVVPLIGVILIIGFSLCFKYAGKYDNHLSGKPIKSFSSTLCAIMRIYHPLYSAFSSQKNGTLAIPKVYQMTTLFIYVFSIICSTLIHMVYIEDYDYTPGKIVAYSIIYLICFLIIRPIMNKIKYAMYFSSTQFKEMDHQSLREKSYFTEDQQSINKPARQRNDSSLALQNNKIKVPRFDKEPPQLEGGSSEEGYVDENEMSSSSEDDDSRPKNLNNYGANQRHTSNNKNNDLNQIQLNFESQSSQQPSAQRNYIHNIKHNQHEMSKRNLEETNYASKQNTDKKQFNDLEKNRSPLEKSNGKDYDNLASAGMNIKVNKIDIQIDDQPDDMSPRITDSHSYENQLQLDTEKNVSFAFKNTPKKGEPEMIQPKSVVKIQYKPEILQKSQVKNQGSARKSSPKDKIQEGPNSSKKNEEEKELNNSQDQYHVPEKKIRHVKKYKIDEDDFDKVVVIENEHNFKGRRIVLLLLLLIILIVEMIITFAIMKNIDTYDNVNAWIYAVLGVILFFVIVYDFIMGMLFACIFKSAKQKSKCMIFSSALIMGNPDYRARYSLMLELKE